MATENVTSRKLVSKRAYRVKPRVCATCAFCKVETFENGQPCGVWACQRPDGPSFDVGDGYQWFTSCDGYKSDITEI